MDRRHFNARLRKYVRAHVLQQIEEGEIGGFTKQLFRKEVRQRVRDAQQLGSYNGHSLAFVAAKAKEIRWAPWAEERRAAREDAERAARRAVVG